MMASDLDFCGKCGHNKFEHGSFCFRCLKENCFHKFVSVVLKSDYDACAKDRAAFQQSCWEKEKQIDALRSELEIHLICKGTEKCDEIKQLEAERDKLKKELEALLK